MFKVGVDKCRCYGKLASEQNPMKPTKSYTELYGKPQGNELIWGRFILRMVGPHKFKKVDYFSSLSEANKVFYEWMEENK
jgi:hypothetical protein